MEPYFFPGTSFDQTWLRTTRHCYTPNFKHLSKGSLKKIIVAYFSMDFYRSHLGPTWKGLFLTLGPLFV